MAEDTQDDLPELEGVAMEPLDAPAIAAPPAASGTVSAKDLTDDILGGVDFDLPAPPASTPSAPKPVAPKTPAPSAFKAPASLFGQSGGFGASGLKPGAPAAAKPLPSAAPAVDPRAMLELNEDAKQALKAALLSDAPVTAIPAEASRAMFQLCRVLIKKGIVTADELLG